MSAALLLVGHGSHLNANSSAPIFAHARRIRELKRFSEVRVGFWKEEPSLSRALDGVESSEVVVVPFFISSGYFTNEVVPREMGLSGPLSCVAGKKVSYTGPVGAHPALASVVIQRAAEAGATPADAVAVLGHGTPRNLDSERNVYLQAERVAAAGDFAEVGTVFLDQEPWMGRVFGLVAAPTVVMVPLFVADGWHVGETIPEDLALEGAELRHDGRRLRYAAPVGTHPGLAEVICEIADEALK